MKSKSSSANNSKQIVNFKESQSQSIQYINNYCSMCYARDSIKSNLAANRFRHTTDLVHTANNINIIIAFPVPDARRTMHPIQSLRAIICWLYAHTYVIFQPAGCNQIKLYRWPLPLRSPLSETLMLASTLNPNQHPWR